MGLKIWGKTIASSTFKKRERNKIEQELESKIEELQKADNRQTNRIEELENELKLIREKKINGIILRAKARCKTEGEKSTNYFYNLEKRHFQNFKIDKEKWGGNGYK